MTRRLRQAGDAESAGFRLKGGSTRAIKKDSVENCIRRLLEDGLMSKSDLVISVGTALGVSSLAVMRGLSAVADPLHPKNKWSSAVEVFTVGGVEYLRLVTEIPLAVKERWEREGRPPAVQIRLLAPDELRPRKQGKRTSKRDQIIDKMIELAEENYRSDP